MKNISFLILFLLGCVSPVKKVTDPEFTEYLQKFTKDTGISVNIPVTFMSSDKYAGWCKKYSSGYKIIEIDYKYWNSSNENGKEQIIYHELGHCLLNKEHNNETMRHSKYPIEIPVSIMNSFAFGNSFFYEEYKDHYVRELISN
jgi:hypothetical protein